MKDKYSIWLVPCEEDEAYLSEVIQDLAEEYNAPLFRPHCTLYSPVTDISAAESILNSIAFDPITVTKTGIRNSDSLWKTVFIELEKSHELSTFQYQIESQLLNPNPNPPPAGTSVQAGNPYSFKPHISLIYKEMPEEEKESIIRKLNLKENYQMDKIAIVKTGENILGWGTVFIKASVIKC